MDEVAGILIAVGSLFVGLIVLGWACGDFRHTKTPAPSEPLVKPAEPAPPASPPIA